MEDARKQLSELVLDKLASSLLSESQGGHKDMRKARRKIKGVHSKRKGRSLGGARVKR